MRCDECGCRDLRVVTGNPLPLWRLRLRRCSACGWQTRTIELRADGVVQWLAKFDERGSRLGIQARLLPAVERAARLLLDGRM